MADAAWPYPWISKGFVFPFAMLLFYGELLFNALLHRQLFIGNNGDQKLLIGKTAMTHQNLKRYSHFNIFSIDAVNFLVQLFEAS